MNNPFDSASSFMRGNGTQGIGSFITKTIVGGTAIGRIVVVLVDLLGYRIVHSNPFKITVPGAKSENDYPNLTLCKGGEIPSDRWVIETPPARLASINALYGNPILDYKRKIKVPCPIFPFLGCKIIVPVKDTAYFFCQMMAAIVI